ncbi:MAG: hypothetical protein RIR96_978 [Bacteroidota bacterium]
MVIYVGYEKTYVNNNSARLFNILFEPIVMSLQNMFKQHNLGLLTTKTSSFFSKFPYGK